MNVKQEQSASDLCVTECVYVQDGINEVNLVNECDIEVEADIVGVDGACADVSHEQGEIHKQQHRRFNYRVMNA